MDTRLEILGYEALPHVEVQRLKGERLTLEGIKEPEKVSRYEEFGVTEASALQKEIDQVAKNIVSLARQQMGTLSDPAMLLDLARQVYRKEIAKLVVPTIMLQHLPKFRDALEFEAHSWDLSDWHNRLQGVDASIKSWTDKMPAPFNPSMINTETMGKIIPQSKTLRFPADRVGMADGKYFDRWLTESLRTKPCFFEPQERYVSLLIEFYGKIYLVEAQRDQAEANKQAIAQEKASAAAAQAKPEESTYTIPPEEMALFRESANFQGDPWARR